MKIGSAYKREYSEVDFKGKLIAHAKFAGKRVLEKALQLYYAAQSPDTPAWAKTVIYGALGYFISVVDAIPDFTPVLGYSDDFGVLVAAVATIASYITPEIKQKAADKIETWFGD